MGILDSLGGGTAKKELENLKKEFANLKANLGKIEFERDELQKKNLHLIDKTHSFLQRIRLLISTLEDENVHARAWDLLDTTLTIKKACILSRTPDGLVSEFSVGFPDDKTPIVPLNEDSMITYVLDNGVPLSRAHLHMQDDLAYLERRGVISDAKIVCPVRLRGIVQKLLVICSYAGNVFAGEDDLETIEMVTTLLGLVLTNTKILSEQKQALAEESQALAVKKQELDEQTKAFGRLRQIFSRMVAPEVIEFIEKNPAGIVLGGTRKKIAIMFADIRGFTRMSEKLPPEKVVELLNRYFSRLADIVMTNRGTLDKFMGDAAMVLFGTPMSIDKPSYHAVVAAQEIQDMTQDNMAEWVALGFPAFSVGVGINFQDVLVGNIGSQKLSSYTAIGDGVNIAFRLCSSAQGGEILVSESTYENLQDWQGQCEQRPKISLKGKAEPVTVYALSRYANYREGACPNCGTHVLEGARFCGACGFRRF